MADLRVNFCGVELKNPITTASGTFGFGHEYGEFFDLSLLGGVGVKGLTPTERLGNPAPRIAETPAGILNCVGLQNPGIDRFIEEQIRFCGSTTPQLLQTCRATRSRNTRVWSKKSRTRMWT